MCQISPKAATPKSYKPSNKPFDPFPGVILLRSEMDPDHNRSVITFAGPPDAVAEGALQGIAVAVERIDLRRHIGVHPRIGAADVVPFVPLENATLEDCAAIAHHVGESVWKQLRRPGLFLRSRRPQPRTPPLWRMSAAADSNIRLFSRI